VFRHVFFRVKFTLLPIFQNWFDKLSLLLSKYFLFGKLLDHWLFFHYFKKVFSFKGFNNIFCSKSSIILSEIIKGCKKRRFSLTLNAKIFIAILHILSHFLSSTSLLHSFFIFPFYFIPIYFTLFHLLRSIYICRFNFFDTCVFNFNRNVPIESAMDSVGFLPWFEEMNLGLA